MGEWKGYINANNFEAEREEASEVVDYESTSSYGGIHVSYTSTYIVEVKIF